MATEIPQAVADVELQLASAVSVGGTSFTLSSAKDDDGNDLPAGKYCFAVDTGTSNKEYLLGQLNGTDVTSVVSVNRQGTESSGAVRAHRIGAPIILTNFAVLQRVADVLNGQLALDNTGPLYYDSEPTVTGREEIATVGYVLDASTGDVAFGAQTISSANAGETVAEVDLVYFKTSDQEWYHTDGTNAATVNGVQIGIALGAGTDGAGITGGVQISGPYTTTGLTAGSTYYASDTNGGISTSAGTTERVIGVALSTTRLLLLPVNQETPTSAGINFLNGVSGMIIAYAGSSAPTGFLLCDGSAVSRTTYADLFAVISDTYGVGDGSTTFNVPDLVGRLPVGSDSANSRLGADGTVGNSAALGDSGGSEVHTMTDAEMPSHKHTHGISAYGSSDSDRLNLVGGSSNSGIKQGEGISTEGSDNPHQNMPPYQTVNYIIKT